MAVNDISLTAGMRSNLVSLQSTVDLLNRTQGRLASGKKVNSALDNPIAFFSSQNLNQRASDLSSLKDAMGQAVQTIAAANTGISGISTLIEAAKGVATAALGTTNTTTVLTYAQQYDTIRAQIDLLAADSGYAGTNLLASSTNNLTIKFDNTSGATLVVTAGIAGVAITTGSLSITTASTGASAWSAASAANVTAASITAALTSLATASTTMQGVASGLSANLSIVSARQNFTNNMMNVLVTGADHLTLADMNEEGANMLILQTRQSLGTTALSLSSQAAQSVLRLFG